MSAETELCQAVARVIDLRRAQGRINPAWIATETMLLLDPLRVSPSVVYGGCHLQCRQIAREQLRRRFDPYGKDANPAQHELWPELQIRYPSVRTAKDAEPEYVLLELMTAADIDFNVARLRSEAVAKLKHADALEAYGESRSAMTA
jgi:hypothetical protein